MKQAVETEPRSTSQIQLWTRPIVASVGVYILFFIFSGLLDSAFTPLQASKALAGTGAIFFAASLSLSSICYFWNFLDHAIIYRKHLGIIGYAYALLYSFSLMLLDPERYVYHLFDNLFTADVFLGLSSMILFTAMVIVSNKKAMEIMGPHRWKAFLRVGFFAWFLLALRAAFLEWELWTAWFSTFAGFPPPRMLLSMLVVAVIGLRFAVNFSKKIKKQQASKLTTNQSTHEKRI